MVKTKTHTKAKVLTAITVAAAGVAAYAVGMLPLSSQTGGSTTLFAQCQDVCAAQQNSCNNSVLNTTAQINACANAFQQCANLCAQQYSVRSVSDITTVAQNGFIVQPNNNSIRLNDAWKGQGYDQLLVLDGQTERMQWKLVSNALPPGMLLDESGHLYGAPSEQGTFQFALSIHAPSRSASEDMRQTFNLVVKYADVAAPAAVDPLRIVSAVVPDGRAGDLYAFQFAATGGSVGGVNKWRMVLGNVPGLALTEDGKLSGTPTASGVYNFTLLIDHVASASEPISDARGLRQEMQITILGANAAVVPLRVTTSALPAATVGQSYNVQLAAEGGEGTYRWGLIGEQTPGLTLSESGVLSGLPTQSATVPVQVRVTAVGSTTQLPSSASKSFTLTVNPQPSTLNLADQVLPKATVGQPYSATVRVTGGDGHYYWNALSGRPPGLTLSSSGVLSGTPTTEGVYTIRLKVGDDHATSEGQAVISVEDAPTAQVDKPVEPVVENTTPTNIVKPGETTPVANTTPDTQKPEETQPVANTNPAPTKDNTGKDTVVVNTPTETTTNTKDDEVDTIPEDVTFVNVGSYPDGFVSYYYNARPFDVIGGEGTYTWSIVGGSLPNGLTMGNRGEVAGTPTRVGTFSFVMQVMDANGDRIRANRIIEIRSATEYTTVVNNPAPTDNALLERLAKLRSIGVSVNDLIKLQDDGDPDTQYDTTVYYIGSDGRRHSFPNNKVYFSWFVDYASVRVIAPHDLSDIPLGANVTYRPGMRLVKFVTSDRVYAVDAQRRLRWIRTDTVASRSFGSNWMYSVDDISDAFYLDYQFGNDILAPGDYSAAPLANNTKNPSQVLPE